MYDAGSPFSVRVGYEKQSSTTNNNHAESNYSRERYTNTTGNSFLNTSNSRDVTTDISAESKSDDSSYSCGKDV